MSAGVATEINLGALIVDQVGAFVPGARGLRAPLGSGALDGLSFGVKDLFDVAGEVTSFGNPDWARTHGVAVGTSPLVTALLSAGARLVGKTKTVELAYGLTGENIWHGTPVNPAAPARFPGGSSCGSAAGTAAGLFDFALGSDTGGSVRIPASYCGLFGIRPTQGALSLAGACPLAPSFDTPGWFAREINVFSDVADVLLTPGGAVSGPLLRLDEAWVNAEPAVAEALRPALRKIERVFGAAVALCPLPEGLPTIYQHFRAAQAEEAWASLGGWLRDASPALSPAVAERFAAAQAISADAAAAGRAFRKTLQARLRPLLEGGAVLIYPTSPCPAPLLSSTHEEQNAVRERTICVTAIAGLCGLPEVTVPVACVGDAPVGISFTAAAGRDHALIRFVRRAATALGLAP